MMFINIADDNILNSEGLVLRVYQEESKIRDL